MTISPKRLTGIVVASISLAGSLEASSAYAIIPAQFSMGRTGLPNVPPSRKRITAPANTKVALTPEEYKRLAKAMKRLTPEERRQIAEVVKRQLTGKESVSRAARHTK
jgi:hypothetical protein